VNVVSVPKTIDNDLSGTDVCFGFDTAVMIATEAVDRLHSTPRRTAGAVVEVMGRDAGWIAVTAGIAGGADVILTPEHEIDMDDVVRLLRARWECGKRFGIVSSPRAPRFPRSRARSRSATSWTPSATPASAASARSGRGDREAHRLRDPQRQPGPHPARRNSHGVRPHVWRRAMASPQSIWCMKASSAAWRCSREPRSATSQSPTQSPDAHRGRGYLRRHPRPPAREVMRLLVVGCWLIVAG